ncbi:MAG: glycosyltransferase family 2 protein [archaeon]
MKLSIIIPVYNEEKTIEIILKRVMNIKLPIEKEIICVDDGSTDNSSNIIKKLSFKNLFYYYKKNGGKGSAVRFGLSKASGDIFLIQDADLEYDPEDYIKLLEPILTNKTKVVYGSRYLSEKGHLKEHNHLTFKVHKIGNSFLTFLTSFLYSQRLTDMETCYKMFTRDVYEKITLNSNKFDIEPEITAKVLKEGYKIREIPINYYSRDYKEGKKITWKDGVKAVYTLLRYRFLK